ncbi:hypothetical protein [Arenimonas sp.]|nr:hypothetical protein [Arenimonas sp.]
MTLAQFRLYGEAAHRQRLRRLRDSALAVRLAGATEEGFSKALKGLPD